ncbi:sigma-54-dependent Fis family transcriptional regulator, partial [Flavihumibacter sediminis]|nr:sigma-54-dependent Fis family transcriptional regulator [Flavihumibacter sediminis]
DIPLLFRKFAVDFAERYKTPPVQLEEDARQLLINYSWPGNVRELKNIAEQISVLAGDKSISALELKRFLPEQANNRLPMLIGNGQGSGGHEFNSEREILYK